MARIGRGSATRNGARFNSTLRPLAIAVALSLGAGTALANPTGPRVVNGQVSFHQAGNLLQVTNSPNAIINWQSFSIGANEITRFLQQSAASAVLNRVTGAGGAIDPSVILGALHSNGRVFLLNPSGIVFGAGSQVDVAGLVASSLNLSNADFLAGRLRFTEVPGAGAVVNQGALNAAAGGEVYLVGSSVMNSGVITTPQGEVVLAAGRTVELVSPGTPNLRVAVSASEHEARNLGSVVAEAGRVGIYAGLINHSGTIHADTAVATRDGRVVLRATRTATLDDGSVISASGARGGEILVLAGEKVQVAGRLDASAPNGGDGGFVETSAARVKVEPGAVVTTFAPHGRTGVWLIDPPDYVVAATGGDITGATLGSNLNLGNVVINSDQGAAVGNGDIRVNDTVSWSSAFSLTLDARRDVRIDRPIQNAGAGDIYLIARGRDVSLNGGITTGGFAFVRATAGRILDANASAVNVTAQYLEAAAAHGIALDAHMTGFGASYVNATNSTSGNIVIRATGTGAKVQNIHNAGGDNVLSGLATDAESTIITGGIVIHGDWGTGSGGRDPNSPLNPRHDFSTTGGAVRIILNSPRASISASDPYVYLLDSGGVVLRQDDDAGQGYVSMINPANPAAGHAGNTINLAAGNYTVVAATYSAGQRTPYDLSIGGAVSNVLPPPPPEPTPVPLVPAQIPSVNSAIQQVVASTNTVNETVQQTPSKSDSASSTTSPTAVKKKKGASVCS